MFKIVNETNDTDRIETNDSEREGKKRNWLSAALNSECNT